MNRKRPLETEEATKRIIALAERQHGVIATRQLRAIGVSWEQIRGRSNPGWLRRLHQGVYAIAGRERTQFTRWMGAVLAAGSGAVLSHIDASALLGLSRPSEPPIHVTIPAATARRPRRGISLHRADLHPAEMTRANGIPVTGPARTILDLATVVERRPLERIIDEAERLRLCGPRDLETVLESHRGRAGTSLLADVLGFHAVGTTRTRSELEERFLALCRERGLPQPLVNAPLLGLTVDFFWPPAVVVEVDGAGSHLTRRGFQDDRDRDSLLAAHGYLVVRFTWWDVERRRGVVADRVRKVLARGAG